MKNVAWIGMVLAGCGSPAFIGGFDGEEDGGVDALVQHDVVRDVMKEEDAKSADSGCIDRYVALPGTSGSYVSFPGPDLEAPFAIEMLVRTALGGHVGIVRRGPEIPCGWHLYANEGNVHANVTNSFDHWVSVQISGTGWRRVRWEIGVESVLFVDDVEVGRMEANWPPIACSGVTKAGVYSDGAGSTYNWNLGDVDSLSVGSSRWEFDEETGDLLDEAGKYPGTLVGGAVRKCE